MTLIYDLCKSKNMCEGGDEIETSKFVNEDDPLNEKPEENKKVSFFYHLSNLQNNF